VSEVPIGREASISLKGSSGKELRERCLNELEVQLDIDGQNGLVRLRGSVEKMDEAKLLLSAFADANCGTEVDLLPDDHVALTAGGDNSLKKQIQDATGAQLFTNRDEGVLKIRGTKEAVAAAEAALKKALDGDDDGSVALVPVDPDALPALIGKAGATINKFREDHGVDVIVLKVRNQIRLRGEPAKVAVAAEALTKHLAALRITFTVNVSREQLEALDAKKALQTLAKNFDVNIDRTGEGIKLRGLVTEASEARRRLLELVSGRSKLTLAVTPEQMAQLIAHGDSNWRRVREDYAVSVDLDRQRSCVVLQGGVGAVAKAKDYVFRMLDFLYQGQFARVMAPYDALPALAAAPSIAAIRGAGVQDVWIDRESSCVRLRGDPESIARAQEAITLHLETWLARHANVPVEAWMLPVLIGKGGSKIRELEKSTETTVDVDREGGQLRLSGEPEAVQRAKAQLIEQLETIRREHAELEVPQDAVPSLVGKKGANIGRIREESGANIDIGTNGASGKTSIRLRGAEEQVAKAKELIQTFVSDWLRTNISEEVSVQEQQIRLIVGKGGSTVKHIHDESGARVEIER
jgi:transcription antitermination factor NusA-like protein